MLVWFELGGLSMGCVSFLLLFLLPVLSFPEEGTGPPPSPVHWKPGWESFASQNGSITNCPPSPLVPPNNTEHPFCPPFHCKQLGFLRFPFSNDSYPECGWMTVRGCTGEDDHPWIMLEPGGTVFKVKSISDNHSMVVHNFWSTQSVYKRPSCELLQNLTHSVSLKLAPTLTELTLFKCYRSLNISLNTDYTYYGCADDFVIYYNRPNNSAPFPPPKCSIIQYPVDKSSDMADLAALLISDITLQLHIPGHSRIQCPYVTVASVKAASKEEIEESLNYKPPSEIDEPPNHKLQKLVLGVVFSVTGIGILLGLIFCFNTSISWENQTQKDLNVEALLRNHGSLVPKRYHYSEVKKMTSSFKDRLGEGGYGVVYKGKLPDGHSVAVKVLSETKGNGEEFINEIASIIRTSHVNIVSLLGYCFHSSKRALIYEFMPNGSLDKFIYERNSSNTEEGLGWKALYNIAIGIARGLQYLHRGCNARILHFDIKPHNILLDENFCPKISDFGLSKLCPQQESIISMSGARGTAGYIAPEVFSRSFGDVSHKSDVYSYGMMVLEMVGGRKNIEAKADRTSEIYFPHWIYKHLELDEEIGLRGLRNEEERTTARKMVIVGLWCIQTKPSNRPSMSEVVDMLQGSIASLQIPPKPFLYSPPRSMQVSSTETHSLPQRLELLRMEN